MQVARTTVQRIYEIARKKIADALIDGHPLRIEGGDFRICDGQSSNCSFGGCYKQEIYKKYAVEKGEGIMRIAVTYENGQIFQHFGHTETFKIYDVEEGKVLHSEVVDTNGNGHGALAGVLNALNADVLICGGIGGGAQTALAAAGIKLLGGVSGDADKAVEAFINDTLDYNPDVFRGKTVLLPCDDPEWSNFTKYFAQNFESLGLKKLIQIYLFCKHPNQFGGIIMKAHKYWSIGAIVTMVGTFYTGYKGLKAAHKYFAFGSLICMTMAVYSGHKMISGNKRTRKQVENTKAEE